MESQHIQLDDDGIPILDQVAGIEDITEAASSMENARVEQNEALETLTEEQIQTEIDNLAEDLQSMMSWRIKELLKEELGTLITQATEKSAPKIAEEIHAQLQLAIPELLARAGRKGHV